MVGKAQRLVPKNQLSYLSPRVESSLVLVREGAQMFKQSMEGLCTFTMVAADVRSRQGPYESLRPDASLLLDAANAMKAGDSTDKMRAVVAGILEKASDGWISQLLNSVKQRLIWYENDLQAVEKTNTSLRANPLEQIMVVTAPFAAAAAFSGALLSALAGP